MNWKKIIAGLAIITCLGSTAVLSTSCKTTSPASSLRTSPTDCDCRDLECWNKKSNKASAKNFSCAANALNVAAAFSPGTLYPILADLALLVNTPIQVALDDQSTQMTMLELLGPGHFLAGDTTRFISRATIEKNPGIMCISEMSAMFGKFYSTLYFLSNNINKENHFSPTFYQGLKGTFLSIDGLAKMTQAFGSCLVAIDRDPAFNTTARAQLRALGNGLNSILLPLRTVFAVIDCGFTITEGGQVLLGNSLCMMDDFKALAASQRDLDSQRQHVLDAPMPNQPDESTPDTLRCNLEPDSCNTAAYKKFGIWLGQQTYIRYATRSGLCADMCGNRGNAGAEAKSYQTAIFGDDATNCLAAINTAQQCHDSIDFCISYCCNQDSSCADAARGKLVQ